MKNLALWIFVLSFISVSLADITEVKNALKKKICDKTDSWQTCLDENNVTEDEMFEEPDIINGLHKLPENEERTQKNACVHACLLQKEGLMEGLDIKGDKLHDDIREEIDDDNPYSVKVHKIINKCLKDVKDAPDANTKAFALVVCIMEKVHVMDGHGDHTQSSDSSESHEE